MWPFLDRVSLDIPMAYPDARYTGTRLDGEKDFYEEFFGGFTRSQNVMISAADGSNAATPAGLNATLEVNEGRA